MVDSLRRIIRVTFIIFLLFAIIVFSFTRWIYPDIILPRVIYENASELLENGQYDLATEEFLKLGNYKDSAEKVNEAQYKKAEKLLNDRQFEDAIYFFECLGDYMDSAKRAEEANDLLLSVKYDKAIQYFENYSYHDALDEFNQLGSYKESETYVKMCTQEILKTDLNSALFLFSLIDYDVSPEYVFSITEEANGKVYKTGGGEDFDTYRYESASQYAVNGIWGNVIFEFRMNSMPGLIAQRDATLTSIGWYCPKELESLDYYTRLKTCMATELGEPSETVPMTEASFAHSFTKWDYCCTYWCDIQLFYSIDARGREEVRVTKSEAWELDYSEMYDDSELISIITNL